MQNLRKLIGFFKNNLLNNGSYKYKKAYTKFIPDRTRLIDKLLRLKS